VGDLVRRERKDVKATSCNRRIEIVASKSRPEGWAALTPHPVPATTSHQYSKRRRGSTSAVDQDAISIVTSTASSWRLIDSR
jgi:hypothetical protein